MLNLVRKKALVLSDAFSFNSQVTDRVLSSVHHISNRFSLMKTVDLCFFLQVQYLQIQIVLLPLAESLSLLAFFYRLLSLLFPMHLF